METGVVDIARFVNVFVDLEKDGCHLVFDIKSIFVKISETHSFHEKKVSSEKIVCFST